MGTGFIGSELSSVLKAKYGENLEIDVISMESVPLERQFGKIIGKLIYDQHDKHEVRLHMNSKVVNIQGDGTNATGVTLESGQIINADLILIGAGVLPQTQFLRDSNLEMDRLGGLICDPFLQTSQKDVYSAGDVCSFPFWYTGQRVRMEHWTQAQD